MDLQICLANVKDAIKGKSPIDQVRRGQALCAYAEVSPQDVVDLCNHLEKVKGELTVRQTAMRFGTTNAIDIPTVTMKVSDLDHLATEVEKVLPKVSTSAPAPPAVLVESLPIESPAVTPAATVSAEPVAPTPPAESHEAPK